MEALKSKSSFKNKELLKTSPVKSRKAIEKTTFFTLFADIETLSVFAPADLSPSLSSRSLTISLIRLAKKENTPNAMSNFTAGWWVWNRRASWLNKRIHITNAVKKATVIFPIKNVYLKWLLYKYKRMTARG